ncbi:hypothetical protein OAN307_c24930 [Octadecabacter antarcticus 307]|uniref:Uncharacterized protein n=1 Tax=Octadecabacter antarcticus 307 TaxID=391626 RepID=M9R8H4_9RHOB|nr:hypothetical protein [Octadecabacter antarcticus]AGI68098.1 hypothetical protein OAN307_c24930 [Octadecabacter antarcticus 307]
MNRSAMLSIIMIIVIVILALIAISSGRSDAPDLVGDDSYPHYVCTTNNYCEGDICSREPLSFVVYLRHADGLPRLELRGFSPRATLTEIPDGLVFESTGGDVSGTLTVFEDRGIDLTATSGESSSLIEYYASGSCERLVTP